MEPASPFQLAAECLVAVTGIFQREPVTEKQGRLAEGMPKEWRALLVEWLESEKPTRFRLPKPAKHQEILADLTEGIDDATENDLTSLLVVPELGAAYLEVLHAAREYVRLRWRVLKVDTPMGEKLYDPGRVEMWRAATMLSVVDGPERVIEEIRMGSLTGEQVEAFKACFPRLHQMVHAIIQDEIDKRVMRSKSYSVPHRIESTYRTFLGLTPTMTMSQVEQAPAGAARPSVSIKVDASRMKFKADALAER